jgi:hypothetical protein
MDVFPKFIIEDDCLIMSKVTYHKDMVIDKDKVKGGGWFKYSSDKKTFIFYGESHDFGSAKFADIVECVKNRKVYSNPFHTRNMCEKYEFAYDSGSEIIPLVKGVNIDEEQID